MATKSLSYFMRSTESEVVTVKGPATIKDDKGEVLDLEIKVLTQAEINRINGKYKNRKMATDKKGNPLVYNGEVAWQTEKDIERANRHIIVEALQYPNLKDAELMKHFNCFDITEMPLHVFSTFSEYQHVNKVVMQALGIINKATEEEELEEAKN